MKYLIQTGWVQYAHSQCRTSLGTSYGSHLIEEVPLTLEELSCHNNVQRDVCRPFRPHPRVVVFGSLLQQEIANLSKNCVCVWDSLLPIDLEWPKGHHHLTGIEMKIMMSVRKWINHRTSLARRQKCVKLTPDDFTTISDRNENI